MKAKLVKRSNGRFDLYKIEDVDQLNTIASSFDNPNGKLSLKNCEAIELGYDLDELAYEKSWNEDSEKGFINGAKAILEILGDKKFSEENMLKSFIIGVFTDETSDHDFEFTELMKDLQQTEWDVEIVMETCSMNPSDLDCSEIAERPKLDENGCLILKRI